jgi:TolA-binding protein
MNRRSAPFLVLVLLFAAAVSYSQEYKDKFGLGLNAGGRRVYGDGGLAGVGIGLGFEGFGSYRILRFADVSLALGYSQLKYDHPILGNGNTTDIFNVDLRTNLEIISRGLVRPYLSLGIGALNFHIGQIPGRKWEAALMGGGGIRFRMSPRIALTVGADYRHTSTDALDAIVNGGTTTDGYLSVGGGFAYYFPTASSDAAQFIADAQAPIYEIGDEPFADPELLRGTPASGLNAKDMEEYARLKSRVDELNRSVEEREKEIASLQSNLSERRKQLSGLEKKAASQPPVPLKKATSMSGFSQVYEEALTNYYNENYTEAISLFRLLLQQNPNHTLIGNCHYWIGQSLLAQNRLSEAVEAFNKVLEHKRSSKLDDAFYQLGRTFLRMGNKAVAKQFFTRLVNECPSSEYISDARSELEKL